MGRDAALIPPMWTLFFLPFFSFFSSFFLALSRRASTLLDIFTEMGATDAEVDAALSGNTARMYVLCPLERGGLIASRWCHANR